MVSYTIEIKVPEVRENDGFLNRFWDIVKLRKPLAERKIKKILEEYARDGHRELSGRHYQKQTGRLAKSTRAKGGLATQITLYVDETQADYARYVVNPRKNSSWKGDPFIDETMDAKREEITNIIRELYTDCVVEWNQTVTMSIF